MLLENLIQARFWLVHLMHSFCMAYRYRARRSCKNGGKRAAIGNQPGFEFLFNANKKYLTLRKPRFAQLLKDVFTVFFATRARDSMERAMKASSFFASKRFASASRSSASAREISAAPCRFFSKAFRPS